MVKELTQKQVDREIYKREMLQKEILEKFGQELVDSKKKELCYNCELEMKCSQEWKLIPLTSSGENCPYVTNRS